MKLNGTMSKLMGHVFAQIDGVVWDLMSNQTGIKREDGIYTLSSDGQVELNPFDSFAMELPSFSQLIPIEQVKRGDVLVSGGKPTGWVLEAAVAEGGEGEGHPCVLRPELPQEPLEVRQGCQGSHDRAGQVR